MYDLVTNSHAMKNRSLLTLTPAVESVLDTLSTTQDFGSVTVAQCLDRLLPLENSMNEFGSQVEQVRQALIEVLENDEDMSEMYLTEKKITGQYKYPSLRAQYNLETRQKSHSS